MPNPIYTQLSSVGSITTYVDPTFAPTTVAVVYTSTTMTATYGLQYTTFVPGYAAAIGSTLAAVWFNDGTLSSGTSSGAVTSYSFPIGGVRLNVTAVSSGTVSLQILQREP